MTRQGCPVMGARADSLPASRRPPSDLINASRPGITHSRWARCFRPVRVLRTTIRTRRKTLAIAGGLTHILNPFPSSGK